MSSALCLLAKDYKSSIDPTGWWLSEKLDGVRALWDGKVFMSRNGNIYNAPEWFTAKLPSTALDGELFMGRKLFQKTVSAVRKKVPIDAEWQGIQYRCFDAPTKPGPFERRLELVPADLRLEHVMCRGRSHLEEMFNDIVAAGGEGVMLRQAHSMYVAKRSDTLLKLKPELSDEAVVTGHQPGEGKHLGRLGALICEWNGKAFNIGTGLSDAQRESPPKVGARVTFSYQELTDAGIPRFPVFVIERDYE